MVTYYIVVLIGGINRLKYGMDVITDTLP